MSGGPEECETCDLTGVWVVIAAFNEGPMVFGVVSRLMGLGLRVLVVDDGSEDDTATYAAEAGAMVVAHPFNLGQGAALQTGIDFVLRRGAEIIVTFDADGQHLASDILSLISSLQAGGADIAFGSRFLGHAENISKSRYILLKLAILFTNLSTGLCMTDAHNGLRAMTRQCAKQIRIRENRMAHASELIRQVADRKLRFVEVPVTIRYSEYSKSKGQKSIGVISIVFDLVAGRLFR